MLNANSFSKLDVLNFPQQLSNTDFSTFALSPSSHGHLPIVGCSFAIYNSRHHRGFTYNCPEFVWLWRFFDVQCCSIWEMLKHKRHQHHFFLALDLKNRKCKACPKDNEKYVFVCTSCDFILRIRCANLPLVSKHKYDTHLLKLTYVAEDDSKEYYCLICEEKRDRTHCSITVKNATSLLTPNVFLGTIHA
jgi:hypothetical protein